MKNSGKIFEDDFRKSIDSKDPDIYLLRLKDEAQAFQKQAKFSHKNPFDFLVFDGKNGKLYGFELKTTKFKYMTFDDLYDNKEQGKMIHLHQIKSLINMIPKNNVDGGFLFNFRDEEENIEKTYYMPIKKFCKMAANLNKKSFNEKDLIEYSAIHVEGIKKRTHYRWDIKNLLSELNEKSED